MAEYALGDTRFTTSLERDRFSDLRRRFVELGRNHQRRFDTQYATFATADELFERLPIDLRNVFAETTSQVAHSLVANGIFDVSEKSIRAGLEVRAEAVADRFNRVQDQYVTIIGKTQELEAQRQEARDNRGRIVGGGFGVEGAARGMVIAAAANAVTGLAYGLANTVSKAASDLGDKEQKQKLLRHPATKASIGDFLVRIALQGADLVAEKVNNGTTYEAVSADARQKSAAIVANVAAGRVPKDQIQSVLVQALTLDPFNAKAWTGWLDRFGDQDGSVSVSAKAFGVEDDVKAHKAKLVADRKAALSWKTPEECRANSAVLEEHAERLGVAFDSERSLIEARAAKLDRERRTFNGVEYKTLAEADAARKADQDEKIAESLAQQELLSRTLNGTVYDTRAEADEARELIREQTIAASRANSFIGWLTLAYRRCFQMKNRSSRKEFWMFILSVVGFLVASSAVINFTHIPKGGTLPDSIGISLLVYTLGAALSLLTVQIRRFHDLDLSGWFVLLNAIPYVGWAIVLLFMLAGGTRGDNRFGPDPRQR